MARILADASRRTAQLPDAALMPSAAAARRGLQVVDDGTGAAGRRAASATNLSRSAAVPP